MGNFPKSSITRWRRIQLVKHLIEEYELDRRNITFDEAGNFIKLNTSTSKVDHVLQTLDAGLPFMTNGCPGENGEPGCTRPYGSYRPSESYRDFPFQPASDDLVRIREELEMGKLLQ